MVTASDATLLSLAAAGHAPAFVAQALACAVQADLRLLVAGDTTEGNTAAAAALAREIPVDRRIVSVEDTAVLDLRARRGDRGDVVALARTFPDRPTRPTTMVALLGCVDRLYADWLVVDGLAVENLLAAMLWLNMSQRGSITTVATRTTLPLPPRLRIEADDGRQATGQLLAVGLPEVAHVAVDIGTTAAGWEVVGVWDLLAEHDGEPQPILLWGPPAPTWLSAPSPDLVARLEAGGADPETFGGTPR
jgi:hypothetical protein